MASITTNFGAGGANMQPNGHGAPSVATAFRDVADDLTELRTQFIALLVKLDADVGVTDINYEATLTPDPLLTIKA